jgi:PKD repeat protein
MKNLIYAIEQLGGATNVVQWANLSSSPLNAPQVVQIIASEDDVPHLGIGINTSSGTTVVYLATEGSAEDDPTEYGIQKYLTTSTNVNQDLGTLEVLIEGLVGAWLAVSGETVINQAAADLTTCEFQANVAGLVASFTDGSSLGPGVGSITGWAWNFGDGVGTSTEQNPSYTYSSAGTFAVTLVITDSNGQQAQAWLGVTTTGSSN